VLVRSRDVVEDEEVVGVDTREKGEHRDSAPGEARLNVIGVERDRGEIGAEAFRSRG